MDRCALFVDAGYVLADGAMAVHGTRHRESVSWNYAGLLQFLGSVARDRTGLPLLRCYWYEATVEGRRSPEHDALADLPGVKLRLGRMRPGRREGVESEIHRDLITLARNSAVSDALVVSAEEDLAQVIADVQDLGVRVTLLHVTVDGNWTISRALRQECDDLVEIGEAHLRPYVELVVGAEPLREDERHSVGAYPGRALTNGHGPVGPLGQQQALPAGSHQAPPEIYTSPVIAEYQRAAQPAMNGQPGSLQPANNSGPIGPMPGSQGPPPGHQPAPAPPPAPAAGVPQGMQSMPAMQPPPPGMVGQQGMPVGPAPGAPGGQNFGAMPAAPAMPPPLNPAGPGASHNSGPTQLPPAMSQSATLPAMPGQQGQQGQQQQPMPLPAPVGQPTAHHSGPMAVPPGMPSGPQPAHPAHMGHPALGQPGMHQQSQPAQPGHPGVPPHQAGPPGMPQGQPGPVPQPAMEGGQPAYQAPPGPGYQGPGQDAAGGPTGPRQPMPGPQQGPAGPAPGGGPMAPAGQPARGGLRTYPQTAPTGRFTRGSADQRSQQFPGAPADQPEGQGAYVPQQGPYGGPQQAMQHAPVPQAAVSLADAVQAAHGEGFNFGESVARDAPALWLEAVLARKPRMPSDLEARLLQGSALPIDSLLHDEVRHALRRGFWDALERSRR